MRVGVGIAGCAHRTTAASGAMYAMLFTPFEEKGTLISSVYKPSNRNSGAGPYETITTEPPLTSI